jgi:DNA-binding response OmpR family regulator
VAIIDAKMREVDDWHVLTLVLLDRELRSLPVIVSGPLGPDTELLERRLRELGCRLITKPFTAEELLATVRELVESRGAA